jgi:hypothetical protein
LIGCLLGWHRKKWVGVFDYPSPPPDRKCPHDWWDWKTHCKICHKNVQTLRWSCDCCIKMGERFIARGQGIYKIEYGCLVPDEERWGGNKHV